MFYSWILSDFETSMEMNYNQTARYLAVCSNKEMGKVQRYAASLTDIFDHILLWICDVELSKHCYLIYTPQTSNN